MRRYKRIKGWFVVAEHCGFPVYCKSGIQKYGYVWRKGEYRTLADVERRSVDKSGNVI